MKICPSMCVVGAAAIAASFAFAQPSKDTKAVKPAQTTKQTAQPAKQTAQPAGDHKMEAPPGMSEADMKACMEAATPGPMHEHLAASVGTWTGKSKMWMAEGMEPTVSDMTSEITSIMDGKFTKCESKGDMPGMGPFSGFGVYGYDNVSKKFQSTWLDNMGTGMMTGTGELSSDGKTMTWTYTFNCPIQKKPVMMREVERSTGKDTMTLEMFGPDPKTGKEYKIMEISLTRTGGAAKTADVKSGH